MIRGFGDVLSTGIAAATPQRLLFTFVKIVPADPDDINNFNGRRLEPLLSLDKVLHEDLCFEAILSEADGRCGNWDLVLICSLSKHDGTMPTSREARRHLRERIQEALALGDLSRFLVFDRNEQPLELKTDQQLH